MEFKSEEHLLKFAASLKQKPTKDPTEQKRQKEIAKAKINGTHLLCRQFVIEPEATVLHKFLHYKCSAGVINSTFTKLSEQYPDFWITVHNHTPQVLCYDREPCLTYRPKELNISENKSAGEASKEQQVIPTVGLLKESFLSETSSDFSINLDF